MHFENGNQSNCAENNTKKTSCVAPKGSKRDLKYKSLRERDPFDATLSILITPLVQRERFFVKNAAYFACAHG